MLCSITYTIRSLKNHIVWSESIRCGFEKVRYPVTHSSVMLWSFLKRLELKSDQRQTLGGRESRTCELQASMGNCLYVEE